MSAEETAPLIDNAPEQPPAPAPPKEDDLADIPEGVRTVRPSPMTAFLDSPVATLTP